MHTRGPIYRVKGMSPGKEGHYWRKKWANGKNHPAMAKRGERLSKTVLFFRKMREALSIKKHHHA